MVALAFLLIVAVIIGGIFATEGGEARDTLRRPTGLLMWLAGGNWPAKVGGGLLIVGVGALLKYALVNIDVEPPLKLATGVIAAAVLGFGALLAQKKGAPRPVSLALGGAAFGVAYLTAYSAFALFGYLSNPAALGLLAIVSVVAGVYAVTRGALSMAVLAMIGAYLAPAFAAGDAGPAIVCGYYAGASVLTLMMVLARGWRPLIHLSFLFTLAGGVFLGWTSQYYTPAHFDVMGPMLVVLAAIHLAMPIAERRPSNMPWTQQLDLVYLLLLPLVSALLAVVIAPSRLQLCNELILLGVVWLAGAVGARLLKSEDSPFYGVIGILMIGFGMAARFAGLPWELVGLAFAVGALAYATVRSRSGTLHSVLAGLVLVLGAVHILSTLVPGDGVDAFANARFLERLIGATLLIVAGVLCRKVRQSLDTVLLSAGIGWALVAIGVEVIRWDLVSVPLALHWLLVACAIGLALWTQRKAWTERWITALAIGIVATAMFAAHSASHAVALISLVAAPLALMLLALRASQSEHGSGGSSAAAVVMPLVAAIWAQQGADAMLTSGGHFSLAVTAVAALAVLIAAQLLPARSKNWAPTIRTIFGVGFVITLAAVTLFEIQRDFWSVILEFACLAGVALVAYHKRDLPQANTWVVFSVLGVALVLQANMLRLLGPAGTLTIADVSHMRWPALLSLLWAAIGAALTITARKRTSRVLWVGGATLLVVAAVKLVLMDFGSLGELANILAVIAAGGVFILVGWLAPLPPKVERPATPSEPTAEPAMSSASGPASASSQTSSQAQPAQERVTPQPAATRADGTRSEMAMPESYWKRPSRESDSAHASQDRRLAWSIVIVIAIAVMCTRCGREVVRGVQDVMQASPPAALRDTAGPVR